MSWQERRCNAEGFGRPEPFFFLCEERTYSPPRRSKLRIVRFRRKPKAHSLRCFSFPHKAGFAGTPFAAVVSLPSVRLVRSARRMRLLRQPPDTATSPSGAVVIACGAQSGVGPHFGTLRKPAAGSFSADMDGACCPSIFFFGKETKTRAHRFSVPRKGCDLLWRFIIWKQRS